MSSVTIFISAARATAPLALMGLIFWLSAQSDLDTGLGTWDLVLRKLGHAFAFGALAALWYWALRPALRDPLVPAAGISVAYAVLDEYHQSFVAGRSGTAVDVAIDVAGIVVALALLRYDQRVRSALERFGGAPERVVTMSGDRPPTYGSRRRTRGSARALRGRGDGLRDERPPASD
jgi:VanZ family protein